MKNVNFIYIFIKCVSIYVIVNIIHMILSNVFNIAVNNVAIFILFILFFVVILLMQLLNNNLLQLNNKNLNQKMLKRFSLLDQKVLHINVCIKYN